MGRRRLRGAREGVARAQGRPPSDRRLNPPTASNSASPSNSSRPHASRTRGSDLGLSRDGWSRRCGARLTASADIKFCGACGKPASERDAKRGQEYFHAKCSVCHGCNKDLQSAAFFAVAKDLYCQECFESQVNKNCQKCGGAIEGERVRERECFFHKDCFRCSECNQLLDRFFYPVSLEGSSSPSLYFCPKHFSQKYGSVCSLCSKVIEGKAVGVDERHDLIMHLDCFRCQRCDEPIQVGKKFFYDNELPLCESCNKTPRP